MTDISSRDSRKIKRIRFIARLVILLWVGFWGFFLVASILSEPFKTGGLLPMAIYLLFFVIPVFIAWRWEKTGGILFVLVGLVVLVGYPMVMNVSLSTILMIYLTMAFPPLIAGLLFFIYWRKSIKMRA